MQLKQIEPINVEKYAHETESLNIQALDVQELERRLELAAAVAYPSGWVIDGPNGQ